MPDLARRTHVRSGAARQLELLFGLLNEAADVHIPRADAVRDAHVGRDPAIQVGSTATGLNNLRPVAALIALQLLRGLQLRPC